MTQLEELAKIQVEEAISRGVEAQRQRQERSEREEQKPPSGKKRWFAWLVESFRRHLAKGKSETGQSVEETAAHPT